MSELDQARRRLRAAAIAYLKVAGNDLLGQAQRDAPVEEGTLRGSGNVEMVEQRDGAYAEVSFSTVYAARQHEELSWRHPRGGKAKYLEDPLKAKLARYLAGMGAFIRSRM